MILRILRMLRPYRWSLVAGFVCLLASVPLQMFHPLVWMYIVDTVIETKDMALLLPALLVLAAVQWAGTGLGMVREQLLGVAGQRFVGELREKLHAKLLRQSVGYHHNRRSGDLISRTIGDVDAINEVVINGVDTILVNALSFLFVAVVIVWLQWKAGLMTLVPLAAVGAAVWFFNLRVKGLYVRIRERLGGLTARLQEHLLGMLVIKAFAREPYEEQRFHEQNRAFTDEALRGVKARVIYFPAVRALGFLSNVVMIGAGAYYVMLGQFTVGGLVAYRGYWYALFNPVFTLAQANEMFQRAAAAGTRIFEVLDAPEAVTDAPDAVDAGECRGHVRFEGVTFGYAPERPVMEGIDFEVRPGEQLGIVGPSGAGKSTALGLLLRLYDPQAGRVTLDGRDLRALTQHSLRRQTAIVTQEPFLFNDTVAENLRFGRLDATNAEIEEAARQANAHEFIAQLPKGYATGIGERGVKLSGGQKQRLCIARAFLANPRILLLDEATAAVEPESESLIQAALERLMQGRTTVIVTHRLSLVRGCNQILTIQHGRVAERGTHEELVARNGWYARMYALQMTGESNGNTS
ncbi:MAG: ABC transporter ATP-binding protein/permease [Planctomycetes bacterium]|nr:ABC transporter ATP-binding protein/permease [Planctomycetota bacterium]